MAQGLQLIARGLAALQSACGEAFLLVGTDEAFTAVLKEKERVLPDLGTVVDTELLAPRTAFAALPAEGAIIKHVATDLDYRTLKVRPGPVGQVVITVTAEPR